MRTRFDWLGLAFCIAVAAGGVCQGQEKRNVTQLLSWLPADTETVFAATAPFALPPVEEGSPEREVPLETSVEMLPLTLFGFKEGLIESYFAGQTVQMAMEGSRHFRAPARLGSA